MSLGQVVNNDVQNVLNYYRETPLAPVAHETVVAAEAMYSFVTPQGHPGGRVELALDTIGALVYSPALILGTVGLAAYHSQTAVKALAIAYLASAFFRPNIMNMIAD